MKPSLHRNSFGIAEGAGLEPAMVFGCARRLRMGHDERLYVAHSGFEAGRGSERARGCLWVSVTAKVVRPWATTLYSASALLSAQ